VSTNTIAIATINRWLRLPKTGALTRLELGVVASDLRLLTASLRAACAEDDIVVVAGSVAPRISDCIAPCIKHSFLVRHVMCTV